MVSHREANVLLMVSHREANVLLMASHGEANVLLVGVSQGSYGRKLNLDINYKGPLLLTRRYSKPFFDQFHRSAFETIRRDERKLRTHALFKNEIGPEIYLQNMKNPAVRSQVTKFRLSNHSLMIELSRHRKIHKELRFCQFCPDKVETEAHSLIHLLTTC